jgi:hypothetical protein
MAACVVDSGNFPSAGAHWHDFSIRVLICPTGLLPEFLSSPFCKNILLFRNPKSPVYPSPSRPTEGRIAIVTDAGRDAVDAAATGLQGGLLSVSGLRHAGRTALFPAFARVRRTGTGSGEASGGTGRVRRNRVVRTPRCWRQVGGGFAGPDRVSKNLNPPMTVTTSRSPGRSRISRRTIACGNAGRFR